MDAGMTLILITLAVAVAAPFIIRDRMKKRRAKTLVCTRCNSIGDVRQNTPGSLLIELVLWCAFIVPGVIYSLWRHNARRGVCGVCGAAELVPVDSPRGRNLLNARRPA